MEKIQINDYVRTKNGLIGKVNKIEIAGTGCRYSGEFITDTIIQFNDGKVYERRTTNKQIVKHSKNIIDLIEKDDYVNGCRVYEVEEKGITVYQKVENSSIDYNWIAKNEVETIWTKEQLRTIEYNIN